MDIGSQLEVLVTATSGLWTSSDHRVMAKEPKLNMYNKY